MSYVKKIATYMYVTRIETDYEFLSLNVQEIKANVININYNSCRRWPSNARFSQLRCTINSEDTMEGKLTQVISNFITLNLLTNN